MDVSSAAPQVAPVPPAAPDPSAAQTAAPSPSPSFDWKASGFDDTRMAKITNWGMKSPVELFDKHANLEKLMGDPEHLAKIPRDADPKAWGELYAKLGRPETADKYVIPLPDGDKGEFAGIVKPVFHKAGITQSQATELSTWWNGYVADAQKAQQEQQAQTNQIQVNELKQAWGVDYDKHAALVDKAADSFGMTQEQLSALKSTMGPKAAMLFLYNIGKKIAVEDTQVPGMTGQQPGFAMTPEQARAAIAAKKTDKAFAQLFVSNDPKQRMEARAEMDRLHKLAYPGSTDYGAGVVART